MPETTFGAELYDSVRPLPDEGGALEIMCDAFGTMAAELELLTREDADGNAPWSIIMDADRAPLAYLPYIAQFPGQTIPVGTSETAARELIKAPSNQERGGIEKMTYECKLHLTGSQYVRVIER